MPRSEEDNEYNSILSSADDDTADMTFQLLGVTTEDMESFAISVSLMNVKAYGIAVIKPAQDSEDTVKEGLQGFIDQQQQNFQMYLPDQYEVAKNARLETLEDGTVVMVMCEDQDTVFDSIIDSLQARLTRALFCGQASTNFLRPRRRAGPQLLICSGSSLMPLFSVVIFSNQCYIKSGIPNTF